MQLRKIFFVLAMSIAALPAVAQTPTVVTGTITDSNGTPYSFATVSATLQPTTSSPTVIANGIPTQIGGQVNATADANGVFSMNLFCNTAGGGCSAISPSGTTWQISAAENGFPPPIGTGPQVCTATITVTGASQSVTASFNACPKLSTISSSSSLSQISGGVAQPGAAFDFSNVILVQPHAGGYVSAAVGRCGFDDTALMWHCWDGVDNFNVLMAATVTPAAGDLANYSVSGGQFKMGKITPVGGGTAPLFASGIPTALNGDFLRQNNSGIWSAATPGVAGRIAATATEPIVWPSGTGDRGQMVSLTNAGLVTSDIPQCGVAPAVSNPFTTVWIPGAGGAKFTSTISTLNGIAPGTGITYPGKTFVNITCPNGSDYTLLASRAFKAGTGLTETLNPDGTVTGNASSHSLSTVLTCSAASASGTAYTCTTAPTFVPASGDSILFKADVTSTGAVTLNVNSSSAAPVKKQGGGTALVANDFLANQSTLLVYDGTNWQMQGQTGNTSGGTPCTATALSLQYNNGGAFGCTTEFTYASSKVTGSITTALAQFLALKNSTAAVVGTSQGSPVPAICGRAWTGSDVEDCLTWQDFPGNGVNAPITFIFGHTGTSTGQVDTTFPGPVKSGGTTAGFGAFQQNPSSLAIEPCNAANTICEQAPTAVTSYSITKPGAAPTIASYKQTDTCGSANCTETFHPTPIILRVTADFTDASSTALQNITGLGFTFPANQALNAKMDCDILYNQTVAAVADAWGVQDVTVAPTNIEATGFTQTAATTWAEQQLPTLATTTATNIGTFTPSAITTIWHAQLHFLIEHPSNASTSALNVMVSQSTAADLMVIKRGSSCSVVFQ